MKKIRWSYIIFSLVVLPIIIFSNNFILSCTNNNVAINNFVCSINLEETATEDDDKETIDEETEENEDKTTTEEDNNDDNLDSFVQTSLTKIDFTSLENLVSLVQNDYQYSFIQSFFTLIQQVMSGEKVYNFNDFVGIFNECFIDGIKSILPIFISMIIIAILYGLLKNMSDRLNNGSVKKIIFIAIWGVMIIMIVYLVSKSIIETKKTIDYFGNFINIVFPILITIITALGGSYTVSIYQPLVLVFSQFIFKIIELVIFPLFYASFVFTIISGFSEESLLKKLSSTTKSAANWILGIVFSIFITVTTAQGITGASFDSLAIRGAKYALSSYVPVLGNYLSQGFDLVMASFVVVKNAVGLSAVLLIIYMAIFPIIKLLVIIFGFKFVGAIIEPIAGKKLADLFTNTASCLMLLVVILIALAFTIFIFLMLIIYSCNWGL
ncbi:MAG: stage III sporulation protein AE [Clostridia bacterium]